MQSATFLTVLGLISVEADARGLTAISLPAHGQNRIARKKESMPDNILLRNAARQITEYLQGGRTFFDLPLSLAGTDFQQMVWQAIRNIPYGRTMSYGEIARQLGSPSKARAVGGAAHANPLPLVIPCHRVIGADGSLTGFGGGLALKKKLLTLEEKYCSRPQAGRPAGPATR